MEERLQDWRYSPEIRQRKAITDESNATQISSPSTELESGEWKVVEHKKKKKDTKRPSAVKAPRTTLTLSEGTKTSYAEVANMATTR